MSLAEQVWFLVVIGGFLVFIQSAVADIATRFFPKARESVVGLVAGVVIIILGFLGLHFLA